MPPQIYEPLEDVGACTCVGLGVGNRGDTATVGDLDAEEEEVEVEGVGLRVGLRVYDEESVKLENRYSFDSSLQSVASNL